MTQTDMPMITMTKKYLPLITNNDLNRYAVDDNNDVNRYATDNNNDIKIYAANNQQWRKF